YHCLKCPRISRWACVYAGRYHATVVFIILHAHTPRDLYLIGPLSSPSDPHLIELDVSYVHRSSSDETLPNLSEMISQTARSISEAIVNETVMRLHNGHLSTVVLPGIGCLQVIELRNRFDLGTFCQGILHSRLRRKISNDLLKVYNLVYLLKALMHFSVVENLVLAAGVYIRRFTGEKHFDFRTHNNQISKNRYQAKSCNREMKTFRDNTILFTKGGVIFRTLVPDSVEIKNTDIGDCDVSVNYLTRLYEHVGPHIDRIR
ncbi:Hypothetical predicted protein, partial [Paramuricea clavata]